jgi:hypothetical protein
MRGQWNTENAGVISADDAPEPTVAISGRETRPGGDEVIWQRVLAESTRPRLVVLDLSATRVDLQSAEALGQYGVRNCCQRYSVSGRRTTVLGRDRLRNEGVDCKLGGVNRVTTVADAIDNLVLNVTRKQTRT